MQYCVIHASQLQSRIAGDYCLDIGPADAAVTATCSNLETYWRFEQWDDRHTGTVKPDGTYQGAVMMYKGQVPTNRCLEVTGSGTAAGTTVQIADCAPTAGQLWEWVANASRKGAIREPRLS